MKASVFGYGDIGSQTGQALTYLSRELDRANVLECIYPRGVEAPVDYCASPPIMGGRTLPRLLTGVGRIDDSFPHRAVSESLFDYFAARQVKRDQSDVHLYYLPGHLRTMGESSRAGKPAVVRGPSELTSRAMYRTEREARRAGVDVHFSKQDQRRSFRRDESLRMADRIIALSEFVKDSYVNSGIRAEKIDVVPLGVDAGDYPTRSRRDEDPFKAIYIGAIGLAKGIRYLLSAWESLDWTGAELELCGNVSSHLQPFIDAAPETVSTPGFVPPRDHLPHADVFVFPSLTEGFAKAPLEAMASGLPVIVTTNSGVNDIITDGEEGFIVPPCDADAIADRLMYLRNNPKERERMGDEALDTAMEYTWERHGKAVIEVLEDCTDVR